MELVPFEPFSLLRDFDRLIEQRTPRAGAWAPRIDVFGREQELVIRVEVPGIKAEDIDITLEDRTLTISGSRSFDDEATEAGYHRREIFTGKFQRTLVLPNELDRDDMAAAAHKLEPAGKHDACYLPRKVNVSVSQSKEG